MIGTTWIEYWTVRYLIIDKVWVRILFDNCLIITYCVGKDFNVAVWLIVINHQIKFSSIVMLTTHPLASFPLLACATLPSTRAWEQG